jgi:fermentation-respiration switch protein FrsA (DUF1100 family)
MKPEFRSVRRSLLNTLLFFPERKLVAAPRTAHEEVWLETEDGERLHAWWIPAAGRPIGHVLFCHGNGGNIGDRVLHAALLHRAGLDVLLFDYRGYGRSTGERARRAPTATPEERGRRCSAGPRSTPDACSTSASRSAARSPSRSRTSRLPAGLVLVSTFTSVRDMARRHLPFVPAAAVLDAYPSLRLVRDLRAPLLVLHGDRDDLVPLMYGQELYDAAPQPKAMHVLAGVGHNDVVERAGDEWAAAIAEFAREVSGGG